MQNGIVMYHQGTFNDYLFLVCIIALQENTGLESRIKSPDETRDFKKVSISGVPVWRVSFGALMSMPCMCPCDR